MLQHAFEGSTLFVALSVSGHVGVEGENCGTTRKGML